MFAISVLRSDEGSLPLELDWQHLTGAQINAVLTRFAPLADDEQILGLKQHFALNLFVNSACTQAIANLEKLIEEDSEKLKVREGWSIRELVRFAATAALPPITQDEELLLLRRRVLGATFALQLIGQTTSSRATAMKAELHEKLILHNLRLVHSQAIWRATGGFLQYADLFQAGAMGLLSALDRFNPYAGTRFSTYAVWWIRQSITRTIANEERQIRIPVHALEATSAAEPQGLVEAISQSRLTQGSTSHLVYDPTDDLIEHALQSEAKAAIRSVLMTLDPRERSILRARFGLSGGGTHTLQQIADVMGVTRERIRQIEARALIKLRKPVYSRKLSHLWQADQETSNGAKSQEEPKGGKCNDRCAAG